MRGPLRVRHRSRRVRAGGSSDPVGRTVRSPVFVERAVALTLGLQARKRTRGPTCPDDLPRSFERLADLQADAGAIGFYDTGIVPGLAQSADYPRAVFTACDGIWWPSSAAEVQRRLAFRLEQQRRVLEAPESKDIALVLTETALDQVVGSPEVLRGQLEHLLDLGERSDVTLQLVERNAPSNPLLGGGLITLDFGGTAPRIAFNASHGPATYHDREEDTVPMFRAMERVRGLALSSEESADRLAAKLKEVQ
ncbi:DUF5753 domain-containing protein [Saccharopolyspora sp. 6M]|uniref:DUF5753 domain-containing protein n=1 Tax=Saccharopolyspora sp. 6M TaxID=2877237 RepID=UPI001CD2CA44|nr:DUF5753 domain-containing protein [Saccharopolyspora sp. 6M]MCA1227843.1 DUF5753 domain-containing protein [Saccharopolyspora sp. 6M]